MHDQSAFLSMALHVGRHINWFLLRFIWDCCVRVCECVVCAYMCVTDVENSFLMYKHLYLFMYKIPYIHSYKYVSVCLWVFVSSFLLLFFALRVHVYTIFHVATSIYLPSISLVFSVVGFCSRVDWWWCYSLLCVHFVCVYSLISDELSSFSISYNIMTRFFTFDPIDWTNFHNWLFCRNLHRHIRSLDYCHYHMLMYWLEIYSHLHTKQTLNDTHT